jgi:N-acetylglutamate synthase-like GNAT family acetyltransferase
MNNFCLRNANQDDFLKILNLVTQLNLDPSNLEWDRFVVVETADGIFVGCGQIKIHADGSRELASIAVDEKYRGQGIARMIITDLLSRSERPVFLICRSRLRELYQKFGFEQAHWGNVAYIFQKVRWIFVLDRVLNFLARRTI